MTPDTDLPGINASNSSVSSTGRLDWLAEYPLKRRGLYHLGRYRLSLGDPWGLFQRVLTVGVDSEIIVHPRYEPLPPFSLLGLTGSGISSRIPESLSSSAASIREYTSGDSLRHIHWRSTAHTGRYMVKTFDADRSRHRSKNYWVILDMSITNQSGEGDDSTAEYAITLAASLAREYLLSGFRFGILMARGEPVLIKSGVGQSHLTEILDGLAVIEPGGSFSFSEIISRYQDVVSSDATVIIISATTSSALTETYHQLDSRGCAAAYFLIDGASFGGSSTAGVGRALTQLGAPVFTLRRAETFGQSLEKAAGGTAWLSGAVVP